MPKILRVQVLEALISNREMHSVPIEVQYDLNIPLLNNREVLAISAGERWCLGCASERLRRRVRSTGNLFRWEPNRPILVLLPFTPRPRSMSISAESILEYNVPHDFVVQCRTGFVFVAVLELYYWISTLYF